MAFMLASISGSMAFLESDVQVLGRPAGVLRSLVAVFERADPEFSGERLCRLVERAIRGFVVGENAAVGAERQRAEAVSEQPAV
jgi:hypothetical protein